MENFIKVKAEYTVPQMSEADALLKELAIAKQITAQTKEELTPLIMAEGKAKYDAIMEQLQPIIAALEDLSRLTDEVQSISIFYGIDNCRHSLYFVVKKHYNWSNPQITFGLGYEFSWSKSNSLCGPDGLITKWNKYTIIDDLKKDLSEKIKRYISITNEKTVEIQANYNTMHS